jgi:hypothetical protein
MATATKTRSTRPLTKTRQVINHLRSGKPITADRALNKFGVKNLRAMISSIREQFEKYGNWQIATTQNNRGQTVYNMIDTHPGQRVYGFDAQGNRFRL